MEEWKKYYDLHSKYINYLIYRIGEKIPMEKDDIKQLCMIYIWFKFDRIKELKYLGRGLFEFIAKQYKIFYKPQRATNHLSEFYEEENFVKIEETPEKKVIKLEELQQLYNKYPIYFDYVVNEIPVKQLKKKYNATESFIIMNINRTKKQLGV